MNFCLLSALTLVGFRSAKGCCGWQMRTSLSVRMGTVFSMASRDGEHGQG
jgi:hypothetical protein